MSARARALLYLVIAVLAALGTAVLLTRYMDARMASVRVPTRKVVVAGTDLAVATGIRKELVAVVDWPVASLPQGTFTDPKEVESKVLNTSVSRGEPILASKLTAGAGGASAVATLLPVGMRAVAVRVDDVVGVAGFIHPGDHVDVIVTMSVGSEPAISKTILQNVNVLTVGKELPNNSRDPRATMPATVATLMVDGEQAERLALAATRGQLLLALRGTHDDEMVATHGVVPRALVGAPAPAPTPERVAAAERKPSKRHAATKQPAVQATAAAAPPRRNAVEILRGDMFEKREFEKESKP
jgi:pilus assembly protein CpaB